MKQEAGKPNFTAEAQRAQRKAIERKDKNKKAVKRGAGRPRASGPALGNLGVVFRRVVRAASGPALGNLGVVFRRVIRATEAPDWELPG